MSMAWLSFQFPRLGQPADGPATGGELDRRGAVVAGVVIAVGEPHNVTAVADEHRGDDRPDAEQVGERRSRRLHGGAGPFVKRLQVGVEGGGRRRAVPQPGRSEDVRPGWPVSPRCQERLDVRIVDFLGDPARSDSTSSALEARNHTAALVSPVSVALRQQAQRHAVTDRVHSSQSLVAQRLTHCQRGRLNRSCSTVPCRAAGYEPRA